MAILSIASAKGGCGKSTTAILLGAELALDGYTVSVLDCDPNQHACAFGTKAKIQVSRSLEMFWKGMSSQN